MVLLNAANIDEYICINGDKVNKFETNRKNVENFQSKFASVYIIFNRAYVQGSISLNAHNHLYIAPLLAMEW